MKKITTIVVDDEILARINIVQAIKAFSNWQVVAQAANAKELYEVLEKVTPDVVFLDIQMPGEKGTEVARKLLQNYPQILVVFITAFDSYAIQAFELYAMDYILKPFNNQRFADVIARVEKQLMNQQQTSALKNWQKQQMEPQKKLDKVIIRSIGSIRIIAIEDILWFAASGNYVEVHHCDGMHLHRVQLKFLESRIDTSVFCRVHRSSIVKVSEVKEFKTLEDNRYFLVLSNGDQVKVSPTYKEQLMSLLGID